MGAKDGCRLAIVMGVITFVATIRAEEISRPVRVFDLASAEQTQDSGAADLSTLVVESELGLSSEAGSSGPADGDELDALLDQDLTSLRRTSVAPALDVEVSTVSRQASTIGRSPAAVFVVNQEMIRRSGARTLPELLRLVPGLHVAQIDGSKWSISSRGFANRFANKLLVQIDGRTVYTPLFGGVFWDVQDLLLDDIKRIEVIRGPGATIWGANAVNGVINVITKSASETHGVYANAGGGTVNQGFAGGRIGNRTESGVDWRVSGKWYEHGSLFDPDGRADDSTNQGRVGFRTDWKTRSCDQVTFQGDWYQGSNDVANDLLGFRPETEDVGGGNVLGRWTRVIDEDSDLSLQLYYDRTDRIASGFDQDTNTIDVDFQHRLSPWAHHKVIWGLGYRNIWDRLQNTQSPAFISVSQKRRTFERVAAFVQDELTLIEDKLYLTLGTKLSYNTFTQVEIQPSIRFLFLPDQSSAFWGAVSRAVRTPTRATEDLILLGPNLPSPPFPPNTPSFLYGNRDMDSEELIAYELGYRRQLTENASLDATCFYNVYEDLLATRNVLPPIGLPYADFFNGASAHVYGMEISTELQMNACWKMRAWYSYVKVNSGLDPTSNQTIATNDDGTPVNQAFLMSSWDFSNHVEVDLLARYVDVAPFVDVPSYISMDLRCGWRPTRNLELSVVGQNLLDSYHPEYGASRFTSEVTTEVRRGVYGMAALRY